MSLWYARSRSVSDTVARVVCLLQYLLDIKYSVLLYCTTSIGRWDTVRHSNVSLSCFLGKMDASYHFRLIRQDLMASANLLATIHLPQSYSAYLYPLRHVEVEKAVMTKMIRQLAKGKGNNWRRT